MTAPAAIRIAAPADLDRIAEIEKRSFDIDRFSPRQFRYLIGQARGVFLVAEIGGAVAGYVSLLAHPRRSNLRIYGIAVDPAFRGQNIAGMLIEKSKECAMQRGLSSVTLEVRTDNAPALGLYRKHGFETAGVTKGYYHDGADALRMIFRF